MVSPSSALTLTTELASVREEELCHVYERVKGLVRRVHPHYPGCECFKCGPHLTLYDLGWHVTRFVPNLTPEELVWVSEVLDGCLYTWLDRYTPETQERQKLKDAARVLRKVHAARETLNFAHYQRNQGLRTGREVWLRHRELGKSASEAELARSLGFKHSKVHRALLRLKKQGYEQRLPDKTWLLLSDAPPPAQEPRPLGLHVSKHPRLTSYDRQ